MLSFIIIKSILNIWYWMLRTCYCRQLPINRAKQSRKIVTEQLAYLGLPTFFATLPVLFPLGVYWQFTTIALPSLLTP